MSTTVGPTLIFQAVDLAGVLANGVLGGLLARRLGFDPVGFVVLALISGLGGGVLRDLLLLVPPVALHNPAYLGVALAGAAIAFLVDLRGTLTHRGLVVADALALGAWAATGATKAAANAPAPAAAPAKAAGADPAKADGAAGSAEARK